MGKLALSYGAAVLLKHYAHPASDYPHPAWTACGKDARDCSITTNINKVTCGACKLVLHGK
jgi:hypothetical protein